MNDGSYYICIYIAAKVKLESELEAEQARCKELKGKKDSEFQGAINCCNDVEECMNRNRDMAEKTSAANEKHKTELNEMITKLDELKRQSKLDEQEKQGLLFCNSRSKIAKNDLV